MVPYKKCLLGLLANLVICKRDEVLEFHQLHHFNCVNTKQLEKEFGLDVVMLDGPTSIQSK